MDEMLTVPEAAPLARMTPDQLYRACREKQFPHVRIGARIRIPKTACQRWQEEQVRRNVAASAEAA